MSLTEIRNSFFIICYFPIAWKKAIIISIPKLDNDQKIPENYRPIALLSINNASIFLEIEIAFDHVWHE